MILAISFIPRLFGHCRYFGACHRADYCHDYDRHFAGVSLFIRRAMADVLKHPQQ